MKSLIWMAIFKAFWKIKDLASPHEYGCWTDRITDTKWSATINSLEGIAIIQITVLPSLFFVQSHWQQASDGTWLVGFLTEMIDREIHFFPDKKREQGDNVPDKGTNWNLVALQYIQMKQV